MFIWLFTTPDDIEDEVMNFVVQIDEQEALEVEALEFTEFQTAAPTIVASPPSSPALPHGRKYAYSC